MRCCSPEGDAVDEEGEEVDGANASSNRHTFVDAKLLRITKIIIIPIKNNNNNSSKMRVNNSTKIYGIN